MDISGWLFASLFVAVLLSLAVQRRSAVANYRRPKDAPRFIARLTPHGPGWTARRVEPDAPELSAYAPTAGEALDHLILKAGAGPVVASVVVDLPGKRR